MKKMSMWAFMTFLSSSSWGQGVAINTFSPGTTISSSAVNQNFSNLKNAVDGQNSTVTGLQGVLGTVQSSVAGLQGGLNAAQSSIAAIQTNLANQQAGFIGVGTNTPITVTCDQSMTGAFVRPPMILEESDGNYNGSTNEFYVSTPGVYKIVVDAPFTTGSGSPMPYVRLTVNGSALPDFASSAVTKVVKLNAGSYVVLEVGCYGMMSMGMGQTLNFNQSNFLFIVKRY